MQSGPLCLILKAFPCEKYGGKVKLMVGFNGSLSVRGWSVDHEMVSLSADLMEDVQMDET